MKGTPFPEFLRKILNEWSRERCGKLMSAYGLFTWAQYLSTIFFALGVMLFAPVLKMGCLERAIASFSAIISLFLLALL